MSRKSALLTINGPLGSGKTTLLKYLLQLEVFQNCHVIENEFASVSIDTNQLHEHQSKTTTIAGECICCSTGDELITALNYLSEYNDPVIIEATGMANSLKLIEKLVADNVFEKFYLQCNFFVIEAPSIIKKNTYQRYSSEIKAADRVIITKCDLLSDDELSELETEFASNNTKVLLVFNANFAELSIPTTSKMLDYYLNLTNDDLISHNFASYLILDTSEITVDIKKLEKSLADAVDEYELLRAKGDIVDKNGNKLHIEMTPSQTIFTSQTNSNQCLVLIGNKLKDLDLDKLRQEII